MAKKQTRRSISVSRTTYERLKAFCETNNISMSQLVETRVNDFLGPSDIAGMPGAFQIAGAALTGGAGVTGAANGAALTGAASGAAFTGAASSAAFTGAASSATMARAGGLNAGAVVTPSMPRPMAPRPVVPAAGAAISGVRPVESRPGAPQAQTATPPMTSAAARFAVDPPPPIIKPRQDTAAPKPAEKRPDQIFTF